MFHQIHHSLSNTRHLSMPLGRRIDQKVRLATHISSSLIDLDEPSLRGKEKQIAHWLVQNGKKLASKAWFTDEAVDSKECWFLPQAPINIRYVRGQDFSGTFILGLKNSSFNRGSQKTIKTSIVLDWDPDSFETATCKVRRLVSSCLKLHTSPKQKAPGIDRQITDALQGVDGIVQARYYTRSRKNKSFAGCGGVAKTKIYGLQKMLKPIEKKGFGGYEVKLNHLRLMAKALKEVHGRGIIHRDIKVDNLMLDEDDRPVFIDFDLADLASKVSKRPCGTPGYSSVEVYCKNLHWTNGQPADIFALGITFNELCFDSTPYSHPIYKNLLLNHEFFMPGLGSHRRDRILKDYLSDKRDYAYFQQQYKNVFTVNPKMTLKELIIAMAHPLHECRPTIEQVCEQLDLLDEDSMDIEPAQDIDE